MYMDKKIEKIYLILFIIMICLPMPIWSLAGCYIDSENNENRMLATRPFFNISMYETYSLEYNSYLNDNLPFKNRLTALNSWVNYCIFRSSVNERVILGKQKWLFYGNTNDGDPIGDYEGKNVFTDEKLYDIQESVVNVQNRFAEMGIELAIVIPPNKERIYASFMPDRYVYSETSRTDLMIEQLQEANVNVINPKGSLLNLQSQYQLYFSYDTHWNQLGAYIGTCDILKEWGIETINLSELTILSQPLQGNYHICAEDDLARLLNLRDSVFDDEIEYSIQESYNIDWSEISDDFLHIGNNEAPNNKKIFLLGDSFRVAMIPALCMYFSDVYVVHRDYYTYSMLVETKPDYLIVEYVERQSGMLDRLEHIIFEQ